MHIVSVNWTGLPQKRHERTFLQSCHLWHPQPIDPPTEINVSHAPLHPRCCSRSPWQKDSLLSRVSLADLQGASDTKSSQRLANEASWLARTHEHPMNQDEPQKPDILYCIYWKCISTSNYLIRRTCQKLWLVNLPPPNVPPPGISP